MVNIEYSISPKSELKLSAQIVEIFYIIIRYSISPNSELKLSTQFSKILPSIEHGIPHEHSITDIFDTSLRTQI